MKTPAKACLALLLAAVPQPTEAIELDVTNAASIQKATSIVAYDLMKYYTGNDTNTPSTIALLPSPYYWWEAGAMWGAMLDYYHFTNDDTYNDNTYQALVSQVGPNYDYMVPRQQFDEGNDDQAFWGFATMSAAERNFTAPPPGTPSWLQLTINLWNTQAARWDLSSCGGGLKWQIFTSNYGYEYKNSVSNGAFFQLSARLARFTGNSTYLDWAVKTWDWSSAIGLIDGSYNVYDGTNDTMNCSQIGNLQWTYSLGIYLYGAAVLYNHTNSSALWEERTQGLLKATSTFFSPYDNATNVMSEVACEDISTCNNDQWSFKAYLARFMWASTQMAPFTYSTISTLLTTSSKAAAQSCSGGKSGTTCGAKWYVSGWDGRAGVGQELSALEIMQGLLINSAKPPFKSSGVPSTAESTTATSTVALSTAATSTTITISPTATTIAAASTVAASNVVETNDATNTAAASTMAGSTAAASTEATSTVATSTVEASTVEASTVAASTVAASTVAASTVATSNVAASIVAGSTIAASIIAASTVPTSNVPTSSATSSLDTSAMAATIVAVSTIAVSSIVGSSAAASSDVSASPTPPNTVAASNSAQSYEVTASTLPTSIAASSATSKVVTSTIAAITPAAATTPAQVFTSAASCKRTRYSRRAAATAAAMAIGALLHIIM